MIKVTKFKIPWHTNHFKKGQQVFIELTTGNQACRCRCKYRGKNRWVSAWFRWNDENTHLFCDTCPVALAYESLQKDEGAGY